LWISTYGLQSKNHFGTVEKSVASCLQKQRSIANPERDPEINQEKFMNTKVLEISACKLDSPLETNRRQDVLSSIFVGEIRNMATLESVKVALTNADN
jgi:hypothetical protein